MNSWLIGKLNLIINCLSLFIFKLVQSFDIIMNVIKEIDLDKSVITLYDNWIIKIKFKNGVDFTIKDAIIANQTIVDIADKHCFLSLVDSTQVRSNISKDALDHFAKHPITKGLRLAEAIIIDSLHNRILANFYLKFTKSHNPVKVFNNEDFETAINWLLEISKSSQH